MNKADVFVPREARCDHSSCLCETERYNEREAVISELNRRIATAHHDQQSDVATELVSLRSYIEDGRHRKP